MDFESRKDEPRELTQALSLDKPYTLLSGDEARAFKQSRRPVPGVTNEMFRGVSDLITFSNVYFNQAGTLALTAISTWCGGRCASYRWMVFEKLNNGNWEERPWTTCRTMAGNLGIPAENASVFLATALQYDSSSIRDE